jgi:hypothetical protein
MTINKSDKRQWVPEICYEDYEDSELTSGLPFIQIPKEKEVPDVLFFFASTETGEYEVGTTGEPESIVEMELHQFACMKYLQEGLSIEDYDKVRVCLGLLPIDEARTKGRNLAVKQAEDIKSLSNANKNKNLM